jgi:flagellar hook-basal body complex protein FliE
MEKMTEGELYKRRSESLQKFGDVFKAQLSEVNNMGLEADELQRAFLAGDPNVSMIELTSSMKKASQAFELLMEVRNKLSTAYDTLMNLRV